MHYMKSAVALVLPVLLSTAACRSTSPETPLPVAQSGSAPFADSLPSDELRRREAARVVAHLDALTASDRQAVRDGEHRVAQVRSLHAAGRVSAPDLQAAERELLELRHKLLRHELELADAQRAAAERQIHGQTR